MLKICLIITLVFLVHPGKTTPSHLVSGVFTHTFLGAELNQSDFSQGLTDDEFKNDWSDDFPNDLSDDLSDDLSEIPEKEPHKLPKLDMIGDWTKLERMILEHAYSGLLAYLPKMEQRLRAGSSSPFFRKWFDTNGEQYFYDRVWYCFEQMVDDIEIVRYPFRQGDGPECVIVGGDALAYYLPEDKTIRLCPKFFKDKNPVMGPASLATVLLHEFTHGSCNTVDLTYNENEALHLAKQFPLEAIGNAANWQYYLEDIPADIEIFTVDGHQCGQDPTDPERLSCNEDFRTKFKTTSTLTSTALTAGDGSGNRYLTDNFFWPGTLTLKYSYTAWAFTYRGNGGWQFGKGDQWVSGRDDLKLSIFNDFRDYKTYILLKINGIASQTRTVKIRSTLTPLTYWTQSEEYVVNALRPTNFVMIGSPERTVFRTLNDIDRKWLSVSGCCARVRIVNSPTTFQPNSASVFEGFYYMPSADQLTAIVQTENLAYPTASRDGLGGRQFRFEDIALGEGFF